MSKEGNSYCNNPLILVLYLDADFMKNHPEEVRRFSDNINRVIEAKDADVITLFMRTYKEERVECINPDLVGDDEKKNVNGLVEEIRDRFDMHNKRIEGLDEEEENED